MSGVPMLRCVSSYSPSMEMDWPIDHHLRPIYDLLAGGVNVSVTLTKAHDQSTFTYTLVWS